MTPAKSGRPTLLQLMQALAERNARYNQLFGGALARVGTDPLSAIGALQQCLAEAGGILQDHAVVARRNQEFWQGQLASLYYWQAQALLLCCRRPEARRALEQARAFLPPENEDGGDARLDALSAQLAEQDGQGDPAPLYDSAIAGLRRIGAWMEAAQTSYTAATWAMRNGQYQAFRRYIANGLEIAEAQKLAAAGIGFRIQRVRYELLAKNTATDLETLRRDIDYSFDLEGDIATRLQALHEGVPEAFAGALRLLDTAEPDPPAIAQSLAALAALAAAFGQAVLAMQFGQAAQQVGPAPNAEARAGMRALLEQARASIEAAYAALRADALVLASEFKSRLGDFDSAGEALEQAERAASGHPESLRNVYIAFAELHEARHDPPAALRAAEQAVQAAQSLAPVLREQAELKLRRLREAGGGAAIPSSAEDQVYNAAFRAQELFRHKLPAEALPVLDAALAAAGTPMLRRVVLLNRAVAFLDLARDRDALADIDEALALLEEAGAADHAAVAEDLANRIREEENLCLLKATADARLADPAGAWEAAEQGRASVLQRDLARASGAAAWPDASFAAIQPWLAREAAAVLSFGATRYGTLALSAAPGEPRPRADILPLTGMELQSLLTGDDLFDSIPELSSRLLHPLRDRILEITRQARVLYLVPEAGLLHAPLAAFSIETGDAPRTLIDLCPLALTPSLTILQACAARRRPAPGMDLLAVGVGEAGDGPRQFHFRDQAQRVTALPWTGRTEMLLDGDASVGRIAARAPQFSVIFLAAHGRLDSDTSDPIAASRIELAGGQLLSARDVLGWRLSAELIFLNACQSGRFLATGRSQVNGFFRAFPVAGANTLIATLTYVDPGAASELAALFFARRLAGAGNAEALRDAQLEMRKTRPAPDWASHCLLGDFA